MCAPSSQRLRFGLLFISAFFIFGLNTVTTAAMPAFVLSQQGTLAQAGVLNGIFIGAAILLRLVFARLIDQLSAKRVLLIGAIAFFVTEPLHLVVQGFVPLLILRLVQAVGLAAYMPASTAYITARASEQSVGRLLGAIRIAIALSTMTFPLLSFQIIETMGYAGFFLILTVCGIAGTLLLLPLDAVLMQAIKSERHELLLTVRQIASPLSIQLLTAFAYSTVFLYGQIYLQDLFPTLYSGLIFTLLSVGQILSGVLIGVLADRRGSTVALIVSLLVFVLALVLLGLAASLPLLIIAGITCGFGYYGNEISNAKAVGERTKEGQQGFAITLLQNALDIGLTIGSLVFGILSVAGEHRLLIFAVLAGVMVLCILHRWLSYMGKRKA